MGGITNTEIDQQCDIVACENSVPIPWVRHHVDQKAGKPCRKCGGSGRWNGGYSYLHTGRCFRCNGDGGKATPQSVRTALQWVEANVAKVLTLGARRDAKRAKKAADKIAVKQNREDQWARERVENHATWSAANPRHAWALENMPEGEFKDSLTEAAQRGWMTEGRMEALWKKADELELRLRGDTKPTPEKGTKGEFPATITAVEYEHTNNFGELCCRVDFKAVGGWRGRLETRSTKVETFLKARTSDEVLVSGKVRWTKGDYAIIGGRVKVSPR